ncbi:hypothetical protein L227DRAFT_568494 [Lentinus tigrinus ALCF2SS1-6]|uniref:Uncharacterized protein n=1 Tax=Lentinus tigrinus ALCF2SS1-6 TaxID=1328759 RepID=A0A5C2RLZ7_9APHY|nr:hypothetical protein L227DRAFT_568494 [Lentinus tigrinus ALCF2SS1-6]
MTVGRHIPSVMAELCMGLVYDTIASCLFLFRLCQGGALKTITTRGINVLSSGERILLYPARLRALFWTALTNFVVPVIFNMILLAFVPREDASNIVVVFAVGSVSVYVQIVSGLLATLWRLGSYRETTAREMAESIETLKFAHPGLLVSHTGIHVDLDVAGNTSTLSGTICRAQGEDYEVTGIPWAVCKALF